MLLPARHPNLWKAMVSECLGTFLLVAVGVSVVILDFGTGSPVAAAIPSAGLRRLITGFLFGTTGGLIALSPVGKISGAHINPVVSAAFWLVHKIDLRHALGYILAQCVGGLLGALPLLAWGSMGSSVQFGATVPGAGYNAWVSTAGEGITTFGLTFGLFMFVSHPRLRRWTPGLFPFLYAAMVFLEAPISGTSTNPARSIGPMVLAGTWSSWWIYWVGPALGMLIGVGLHSISWLRRYEIEIAKLYHFGLDPYEVFNLTPLAGHRSTRRKDVHKA